MLNFSFFLPAKFRKTELHQHFYRASSIILVIMMTFLALTSTGGAQEHSLPILPKPGSEKDLPPVSYLPSLDLLKRRSNESCQRARDLAKKAMIKYDADWDVSLGKAYEEAYNKYMVAKEACERRTKAYNEAVEKEASVNRPTILISSATYGGNCGVARGNVTSHIAGQCNGKSNCRYRVDHKIIGDPAIGCAKTYTVQYRCGNSPNLYQEFLTDEAGWGDKTVKLTCR